MNSKASARWAPLSYPSAVVFSSSNRDLGSGGERITSIATRVADPFFPLHRDVLLAAVREWLIIDWKIDHRTMGVVTTRKVEVDVIPVTVIDAKEGQSRPHLVPNGVDNKECDINHTRFRNAEALVEYVVDRSRLVSAGASGENDDSFRTSSIATERPDSSASKRKVSDASDDSKLIHDSYSNFPPWIASLVRSNIRLLRTSPSGSKLARLTPQSGMVFNPITPTNAEEIDHAIHSFLRHPRLQREQQQANVRHITFALPRLLEASINDEGSLRARAREMISSIANSFCGNDANFFPLRAYLGYKSNKSPSGDRILGIISDILFDVSHAMYAFIHTQEGMIRAGVANVANRANLDMQIKSFLFDDRALKRIGGFEPESLLPLALGIRRCRETGTSWEEYAHSEEGMMAMGVHSKRDEFAVGELAEGEIFASLGRKRRGGSFSVNGSLLELGKKRRGRRGRSMCSLDDSIPPP
jgi:hypothetical protein